METNTLLSLFLLIPLASAAVITLFFRRNGAMAALISVGSSGALLGLAFLLFARGAEAYGEFSVPWFTIGEFSFEMGILYDSTAALMLFVCTFVGFFIHLFSIGYMKHDDGKGRYFAGLSIFMLSMLGIVLADNILMIYVFWELVGFSSYMLIAHYHRTPEASAASKKAFIVNRVGDFGFLVGMVWVYWHFGTLNLAQLAELANPDTIRAGIALLLMGGFLGKSAHFPLHVWLPDAMAGPTPVSALIHAATLVAAGIYFLVRIFYLFPPEVLTVVLSLGVAMALYAGLVAVVQTDIKKILAYSTLSQLGFMAAAFGLGMPGLAMFHMATHAFFKALLFLGAGSAIHGVSEEKNIFRMGGLIRRMPITSITFLFGTLALAGVTYTSGYYSKESILSIAYLDRPLAFGILLFSAALTAFYMGRLYLIAFLGSPKTEAAENAHESGPSMLIPLVVLGAFSIVGGFYALWPEVITGVFVAEAETALKGPVYGEAHTLLMILGMVAWLVGFGGSFLFYGPGARTDALEERMPFLYGVLKSRLLIDEAYDFYVANIQQKVAHLLSFCDIFFISGLLVRGSAGLAGIVGILVRSVHVGNLHAYVYWFFAGVLVLWLIALGLF